MTVARTYINLDEAAEQLGVHARTVRRWITEGRLAGYRIGPRLVKVKRADLDDLMRRIPAAGQ